MALSAREQLQSLLADLALGQRLHLTIPNLLLVQIEHDQHLRALAARLKMLRYYLVTMVANDERELEDHCFKLYYLFSHPEEDLFLLIETLLGPDSGGAGGDFPSLYTDFSAVDPFEREILDLFGLRAARRGGAVARGGWLHQGVYPATGFYPLRRDQTTAALRQQMNRPSVHQPGPDARSDLGRGLLSLPVGPVHAGIIEPGRFLFTVSGERIEDLQIQLGYTHRGIERLFQTELALLEGWRLAEQVAGDSVVAHSLAYCRAVESLYGVQVPPAAALVRALALELERLYNHVGDVAALAHDVSLEALSGDLAVLRERLLRSNQALSGHRYLRSINRPGGTALGMADAAQPLRARLADVVARFSQLATHLAGRPDFRDRCIGTGRLTREEARQLGATGLVARASDVEQDLRLYHPVELHPQALQRAEFQSDPVANDEARAGDVYARFLMRVHEVTHSARLIATIFDRWDRLTEAERQCTVAPLRPSPLRNYTFAVGYAEGARGAVVYWLMQDKQRGIYRCKVRDPSLLNWPALRVALSPRQINGEPVETLLPDFPLINKSFNLSYSANDL